MTTFAIIGTGELGRALAEALPAQVVSRGEVPDAADCVIAAVPASAQLDVARAMAPALRSGSLYVDPSPLAPEAKAEVERALPGAIYVDASILGTTAADGYRAPFLASGPGAARFRELVEPFGLVVTAIDAPTGAATRVKLLRSVYMKGRDALILEMLLAARRYGVEQEVVESIRGGGEQVPFPALAERVMTALAIFAERRAEELAASADVLREVGVEPLVAEAGAERLRRLAALDLRKRFGGVRPEDAAAVLDAISPEAS